MYIKNRLTDIENKLFNTSGEREEGRSSKQTGLKDTSYYILNR